MGSFHYSLGLSADFDDRLLAHLQLVLGAKLRRGESFYFTWNEDHLDGHGRTTIWLHPALPIAFQYLGSRSVMLNKEWLEVLSTSANSSSGLHVLPEPAATPPRRP
jgi:hypothetical protein